MKLSNKKINSHMLIYIFLVSVVFCLVSASFFYFLYLPEKQRIEGYKEQLLHAKEALEVAEARVNKLERLSPQQKALYQKEWNDLGYKIPHQPEIPAFLQVLKKGYDDCGVDFQEIKFGDAKQQNNYRAIPIDLTIKGSYPNELQFIRYLRKESPRFCTIEGISFDNTEGTGTPSANFRMIIYTSPVGEKENHPKVEEPGMHTGKDDPFGIPISN